MLDAPFVHPAISSFTGLCPSAVFRRQCLGLYVALRDRRPDLQGLESVLARHLPAAEMAF